MRLAPAAALLVAGLASGCEARDLPAREPRFADVEPLLRRACAPCHGETEAQAGWRAERYLEVIGCPDGSGPAVEPPDETAPILSALERPDHADLLEPDERELLTAWVRSGAVARRGAAHPPGWVDPRSSDFHGSALAEGGWVRMLDPRSAGACATCHEAPLVDGGAGAPGATPCASCHREEGGPLACSTCHGRPGRPHPPPDPCFHPDAGSGGAHAAHFDAGVGCPVCHGERRADELGRSEHGDGIVQVTLDPDVAGEGARWDAASGACASACHDRGGAGPAEPAWGDELELDCGSCHRSPPDDHYAGACDGCHREASADGTELMATELHANGRVDLGDGSGECGACHGSGTDPWPLDPSHQAHREPELSEPFACSECHEVPATIDRVGHFDDTVGPEVRFGALASARGSAPRLDAGTCREVACHGAGLGGGAATSPSWGGGPAFASCGACHGLPPPPPHTNASTCGATLCHGAAVSPGPRLTEAGRRVHVDGDVDLRVAP